MEGFFENYISSNTLALIVSGVIFVVTVALVIRNLISFVITCVLLFFAVVSGLAIANNDIVRTYLHPSGEVATADTPKNPPEESRLETIRDRLVTIFQQLVETLSNQTKDHKDNPDKSRQLKSSIEQVLYELDMHRQKLQDFLDENVGVETPALPPRVSQDPPELQT